MVCLARRKWTGIEMGGTEREKDHNTPYGPILFNPPQFGGKLKWIMKDAMFTYHPLQNRYYKNRNSFFHHSYSLRNTMKAKIHISSSYFYIPLTKTYNGKSSSPYFSPPISLSFPQTEPNKVKNQGRHPTEDQKKEIKFMRKRKQINKFKKLLTCMSQPSFKKKIQTK